MIAGYVETRLNRVSTNQFDTKEGSKATIGVVTTTDYTQTLLAKDGC
ncbi:hypothetical protein NIES4071_84620 [Calothrix sp. NIES-4071]|nr:hypothetical protein NIES4071_84620 [Calothrix sp. NIES-4071]BAZ62730.1 hypothetical protein NIES4105_84550 [Calothrix sp. NIES-4105]